jgi:antitoxin component HigA of HigAB toxin-antitoxin module
MIRSAKTIRPQISDDYLNLIRQFPLRAIRSEREYEQAGLVLNRLLGRQTPRLSPGEGQYLDALVELTKAYESQAHRFKFDKMTVLQSVKYLMEQSGLNTEALGQIMGSQTAASLFLSGKRPLSKAQIFKLAERFKVEPGTFLEPLK